MRQFLFILTFFVIIFLVFDRTFLIWAYLSPSREVDRRLEYVLEGKMKKDLIVLGSSRGARNIIASQLEDSLGVQAYNLSYPGSSVEFHEFLLRALLKNNRPPSIILLTVDDPSEFVKWESIAFRLDRLYPLCKYDLVVQELINRNEKSRLARYLVLPRLSKSNFNLRHRSFTSLDTIRPCGSMPISVKSGRQSLSLRQQYKSLKELPEYVNSFQNIIKLCEDNNINLWVILPPNNTPRSSHFEQRVKDLTGREKAQVYIYDTLNPIYRDMKYYYDESHLSYEGAVIFTAELAIALKKN